MMKKLLPFMFVLSLFLLVACTSDPYELSLTEESKNITEVIENDYETLDGNNIDRADFGSNLLPLIHLTEESRDLVLEDFDYLVEIILENTPSQGIFERRFNVSLKNYLAEMRETIYNMDPIESLHSVLMGEEPEILSGEVPTEAREVAAHYLSSLLLWFSFDIGGLGHLGPRDFPIYWEQLETVTAAFHQAEMIDGLLVIDGQAQLNARLEQLRFESFTAESTLWFFGVDLDDLNLYRELTDIGFREEGNITTDIIEEDRIAYLHINNFGNNPAFDSEMLFPFFEEVQDFEHLIIDLRGNGGGLAHYFPNYIVAMLIDEPLEVTKNEFFMSGEQSRQLAEYALASWFVGSAEEILPARDFVNNNDFPYFNEADLDLLAYVIPWYMEIEPRVDNIPFVGEIWLLVDRWSASASELAALISINSGFATVVGEPTMGVTGTMHMYVSLPNTGVLFRIDTGYTIDAYGRSFEEFGIIPDIVTSGAGALRYVLGLID